MVYPYFKRLRFLRLVHSSRRVTSLPGIPSASAMKRWVDKLSRKRPMETKSSVDDIPESGQLDRCLTTLDLISIGVGSCCGTGMYLTAGIIAHTEAGPGGVVSIVLAGLASILTGFHYAELTGLSPYISGSAYMYTYFTVGEFSAFCIGWGQTLEYIIGTSANAVALSETIRSLDPWGVTEYVDRLSTHIGLPPIDFIAVLICLILTWILCSGAKMSTRVNNVLNVLNMFVLAIFVGGVLCLGYYKNITDHGGFFPMGADGLSAAIPTAYFALIGFDGLTTTGGECITPVKSVPRSIILSIVINIVIYSTCLLGLTYLMPYNKVPPNTGMVDVFEMLGYPPLKAFMIAGAIAGLFAATFGSLFPLPRMLQTIAQDGLIFRYLSHIHPTKQTAVRATTISGIIAAFLAGFVDIELLIELVLVGTLLGYIIATYATLLSRYCSVGSDVGSTLPSGSKAASKSDLLRSKFSDAEGVKEYTDLAEKGLSNDSESGYSYHSTSKRDASPLSDNKLTKTQGSGNTSSPEASTSTGDTGSLSDSTPLLSSDDDDLSGPKLRSVLDLHRMLVRPKSWLEDNLSALLLLTYFAMFVMCFMLTHFMESMMKEDVTSLVVFVVALVSTFCLSLSVVCLPTKPRPEKSEGFRTPMVPFTSIITAGINIYLMTSLHLVTWFIFFGWMLMGLSMYFLYGVKHSTLEEAKITPLNAAQETFVDQSNGSSQINVGIDNKAME